MCKIRRVTSAVFRKPLSGDVWNPQTTWTTKDIVLVFVETDNGLMGVGEAWSMGHAPEVLTRLIDDLGERIIGVDPMMSRMIWEQLHATDITAAKGGIVFHAISGIDIALWDLVGQITGRPIYELLGGYRTNIPVYASGGLYGRNKGLSDLAKEVDDYSRLGFRAVKIKVGGLGVEEDAERVRVCREKLGPGTELMVDGVWSYSALDATRFSRLISSLDIKYFEAPVPANNIDACRYVNQNGGVPVCGHDHGSGLDFYRRLLLAEAVSYVLLAPVACGGISEAVRICSLAQAFGTPSTFHASSSIVSFLAALHLAAAVPNAASVEFHQVHQLLFDALDPEHFRVVDGAIDISNRPGLGLDVRRLEALAAA